MTVSRRDFLTTAPAATLSVPLSASKAASAGLINADAVRASLPRLFSGSWTEILSELLQNSQRAGAKHVQTFLQADTGPVCVLVWEDDGHGLDGTVDSFQKLLSIGDSGWDAEVQRAQSPLGLGLHALLAHEQVREVSLHAGGRVITLDRTRWWGDVDYYQNWVQLLQTSGKTQPGLGFRLEATMNAPKGIMSSVPKAGEFQQKMQDLARGYADLLQVSWNHKPLVFEDVFPELQSRDLKRQYEGETVFLNLVQAQEPLTHRHLDTDRLSIICINWYGQEVWVNRQGDVVDSYRSWSGAYRTPGVCVQVRNGSPFTMRAPSRLGVVNDSKWRKFWDWLQGECRQLVQSNTRPAPGLLDKVFAVFPALRSVSCWFAAYPVEPVDDDSEDLPKPPLETLSYSELSKFRVLRSPNLVVIDKDGTQPDWANKEVAAGHLSAIWGATQECADNITVYVADAPTADFDRLPPDVAVVQVDFTKAFKEAGGIDLFDTAHYGWYTLQATDWNKDSPEWPSEDVDLSRLQLRPLLKTCAIVGDGCSWHYSEACGLIYCQQREDFAALRNALWHFWCRDEDEDYDPQHNAYGRSIEELLHELRDPEALTTLVHADNDLGEFLYLANLQTVGAVCSSVHDDSGRFIGFDVYLHGTEKPKRFLVNL